MRSYLGARGVEQDLSIAMTPLLLEQMSILMDAEVIWSTTNNANWYRIDLP